MTSVAHQLADSRGFLLKEDVDLIQLITETMDNPKVVDLGAGSGTTALAIKTISPDSDVTSVDISEENLNWARLALENAGLNSSWVALHSDSVIAASHFEDGSIDFVLIDTSHQLDHTGKEIDVWTPKLKIGGFLWCHDYIGEDGVRIAVDETVSLGLYREFKVSGLGWAGIKN